MTRRRGGPLGAVLAAAVLAGALPGCGVPGEDSARVIDLPRALASTAPVTTGSGSESERLFLIRDGALVRVTRRVDSPPTIDAVVADLFAGPTQAEHDAGLTSALLDAGMIASTRSEHGEVIIDLAVGPGRNDEVLAFAQLVCTLTARADVGSVSFTSNQQHVAVPRADGSLSQSPLTAADYASLMAG